MNRFDAFVDVVRSLRPRMAAVLGSGMGGIPHRFAEIASIPFADVPGLPAPTVHGHSGRIAVGRLGETPLLLFRGRVHRYEGRTRDEVASPIRFAANLGIETLVLTNAAGGIHDSLGPGDLMSLRAHLFLQKAMTVEEIAASADRIGESSPYSTRLLGLLHRHAQSTNRELMAGVYAAVTGPSYETPAEIRALRAMGADAVGMSTAIEAEMAASLGIEVVAISCITNKGAGLSSRRLDHREVLEYAARGADRLSAIIEFLLTECSCNQTPSRRV